jgi:hypothetical protein
MSQAPATSTSKDESRSKASSEDPSTQDQVKRPGKSDMVSAQGSESVGGDVFAEALSKREIVQSMQGSPTGSIKLRGRPLTRSRARAKLSVEYSALQQEIEQAKENTVITKTIHDDDAPEVKQAIQQLEELYGRIAQCQVNHHPAFKG